MPLNVATVGAGRWGKNHIRVLSQLPEANLSMVVDSVPDILKNLERTYKTKTSVDYQSIIKDDSINAVIIATPSSTHYKICKEMLHAGKHIFIEKPMCLSYQNAKNLVEIAKDVNKCLMVGHIFTYNPAVQKIKSMIQEDILGEIRFILCSRLGLFPPRQDCGIIIDLAIHDIDIITYLFDRSLPERVSATGKSFIRKKFEELAFITLEFPNNVLTHINVSWLTPSKVRNFWVSGANKTAFVELMEQSIEIFEAKIEKNKRHKDKNGEIYELVTKEGISYKPLIRPKEPLRIEIEHFLDCISTNKVPLTSGEVGAKAILIAEAAIESIKQNKPIDITRFKETL